MRIAVFDFAHWRAAARSLLTRDVPPAEVEWLDIGDAPRHRPFVPPAPPHTGHTVPRRFLALCADAATATDPDRWGSLYRVAWRLTHGEPALMDDAEDAEVRHLEALAAAGRPRRPSPDHRPSAAEQVPVAADPHTLARAMAACTACDRCAMGEPVAAAGGGALLIVGEAPDAAAEEAGWPLVGDAGDAVGRALALAGVPLDQIRTTYAIKHRRQPDESLADRRAIAGICRPWLLAELALDPPAAIVALGGVAARGVIGRGGRHDDPTAAHDGPGGVPVFVAPALERARLAEAAGDDGTWHRLIDAVAAAAAHISAEARVARPEMGRSAHGGGATGRAARRAPTLVPDAPEPR